MSKWDKILTDEQLADNYFEVIDEFNRERVNQKVKNIYNILSKVYQISEKEDITTAKAAARFAEERLDLIKNVHQNYLKK